MALVVHEHCTARNIWISSTICLLTLVLLNYLMYFNYTFKFCLACYNSVQLQNIDWRIQLIGIQCHVYHCNESTWHYIPESCHLHTCRCENFKTHRRSTVHCSLFTVGCRGTISYASWHITLSEDLETGCDSSHVCSITTDTVEEIKLCQWLISWICRNKWKLLRRYCNIWETWIYSYDLQLNTNHHGGKPFLLSSKHYNGKPCSLPGQKKGVSSAQHN
jgi:hypothetical protein